MTIENHIARPTEEARTHDLFDVRTMDAAGIEWSQARQLVAIVWRACWSSALTVEQINKRAQALADLEQTPDLQDMLTLMTRKKMLRSYEKRGRRLYEVNY